MEALSMRATLKLLKPLWMEVGPPLEPIFFFFAVVLLVCDPQVAETSMNGGWSPTQPIFSLCSCLCLWNGEPIAGAGYQHAASF